MLRFHRSDGFRPFAAVSAGLGDGDAMSGLVGHCEAQRSQGDAMDALLQRLLRAEFRRLDLFGPPSTRADRLDPALAPWFDAACQLLAMNGLVRIEANGPVPCDGPDVEETPEVLRRRWREGADAWPLVAPHWRLADAALEALPEILAGRLAATSVLFPGGSLALVEGVYAANPVSDYFNGLVAEAVALTAAEARGAGRALRVLEIGAGTGGTSRAVFERLREVPDAIEEYRYTDVSKAFLLHARETYAPAHPWLRTALFDVERDLAGQQLEGGVYDLVLATNVLHATRNIRRTLRNAKGLLRNGGLLVLNEMSTNGGTFTHLTFGLTPGWWLFEDPAPRLPGGPALGMAGWTTVLSDEGFPRIAFPAQARHGFGLQLVLAESNGVVRIAQPAPPAMQDAAAAVSLPAPTSVPVATEPAPNRARSGAARLEPVRRVILEALRECLMLDAPPDGDEAFADLGLDSIIGVAFVRRVNERLGIELDHNATFDHSNVAKLARHVLAEHAPRLQTDAVPASMPCVPVAPAPAPAAVPASTPTPAVEARGGAIPIAVVGMSGVFAQSDDLDALWGHLAAGRNLVVPFPQRGPDGDPAADAGIVGGFLERVDEFDALFFAISGQEATYMDPQQRLLLQECWRALEDAGYAGSGLDNDRCGVYVGGTAGDYPALFGENYAPQALWGNLGSLIASRISYFLNLRGPALVVDTACSSSLVSLHLACQALAAGEIDAAMAGGVFMLSTPRYFSALQRAGMLSASGRCRTFDADADGFVPAEGAGAVLLRRLVDALADGDHIHGVIRGSGVNQDGASNGITAPSAASQEQLETAVYASCGLDPRRIQMIEAHGTGTILGDPIEHSALCRAFRRHTDDVGFCAIGSIKTNLGHAQSAAGIAGVLKVLLSLRHRQMPPSLHFERRNPAIDLSNGPFFVNTELREWPQNCDAAGRPVPRCAAVSSFGISGTNAHVVIEEGPARTRAPEARPAYVIALSARSEPELRRQAERLLGHCEANDDLHCGDLSFTLLTGRRHFAERLVCVVGDLSELTLALRRWLAGDAGAGVYRSSRSGPAADVLEEQAERHLDACVAAPDTAAYRRGLTTLAELLAQGVAIDFRPLFVGAGFARVPLPAYPLLRDRYWVPSARPARALPSGEGGCLVNTSNFEGIRFTLRLDDACAADRRWRTAHALPVLMRQALQKGGALSGEDWRLLELRWGARLPVGGMLDLHIGLYRDGDDALLLETYAEDEVRARTVFAQARAELAPVVERGVRDLAGLRAEPVDPIPGARVLPGVRMVEAPAQAGPVEVLSRILSAAGGGDPRGLDRIEGCGDWCDARRLWVRIGTDDRVEAEVCAADGAVLGRVDGWTLARETAPGWLLLEGSWREASAPPEAVPWRGGARLLILPGVDAERVRALRGAWAADGTASIEVMRFETVDGAGFVRGCAALLDWCRATLAARPEGEVLIQALVDDASALDACAAGLSGFLRSAHAEQPMLRGQVVRASDALVDAPIALHALLECEAGENAVEIRRRDGVREVRVLAPLTTPQLPDEDAAASEELAFREGGTYLITGGAGSLGLLLAEHLAGRLARARVVLSGRSALDAVRAKRLAALRRDGFEVEYHSVAVDDAEAMRGLLGALAQRGGLDGIVHAAGTIRDGYITRKTAADLAQVMTAKVVGVETLDALIHSLGLEPEWFVLFSSITGEYGNAGQADYAAANAFLRGFAESRQAQVRAGARRGRTLAIDWPLWRDGGMSVDEATGAFLRRRGLVPLEARQGMGLLWAAPRIAAAHAVALFGDVALLRRHFLLDESTAPAAPATAAPTVPAEELVSRVERRLVDLLAKVALLPPERIDASEALEQYGIDSVMVIQLNAALETAFGALPKTLLYEHRSLAALAEHLCVRQAAAAAAWCGLADSAPAPAALTRPGPDEPATMQERAVLVSFADRVRGAAAGGGGRREPIAIIGITGRYPGAPDLDAFWDNLRRGVDGVGEIPPERWDVEAFQEIDVETAVANGLHYTRAGAFLDGFDEFDPLFFRMSPADAYDLNPQERLFVQSCWTTLEDAGYSPERIARRHLGRVGVFAGITKTGYELHGPALWSRGERGYPHTSFASVANRVSYLLDLNGPSMPVDTMCSASLSAIHEACEHLLRDECEMALAGGVNLYLHPSNYTLLCGQRMLSPTGHCHSFGADGDGFVPGEGVGTVLLKRLSAACRDGDPIRALIRGTAVNHGGKTNGYTVPNPAAQAALVRTTLDRAGIDARAVGYIEAHGTGTRLGDPIEIAGLQQAFAIDTEDRGYCAIGSLKSNIGHLEAAAGIAGLTKIVLQLRHAELVPSLHAETLNPNIDFASTPFRVQRTLAPWPRPVLPGRGEVPRIAGVSSFGAGGANAHVLLEEYVAAHAPRASSPGTQLIVLSARDEARLTEVVDRLLRALEGRHDAELPDIAYTLQVGREAMEERLALQARSITSLCEALGRHLAGERVDGLHRGQVQRNRETIAIFDSDEDLREAVAGWLRKGKYDRLLGLWVKGLNVDWEVAWDEAHPRCVPLPTYPFARERYWISPAATAAPSALASRGLAQLHPLLHENVSRFSGQIFRTCFTGREGVLADHRVQGRRMLPGVAYLEMAREAAARSLDDDSGVPMLRDVVWLRPLIADGPVEARIALKVVDDTRITFEVCTGDAAAPPHCRGTIVVQPADAPTPSLDLEVLRERCARPGATPDRFYAELAEAGMIYGPHQRGVEALWLGAGEALARLRLPPVADAPGYVLHPSLLDAALQVTAALAGDGGLRAATVPFALDEVSVRGGCAPMMWAWVRASGDSGAAVRRLDIDLCDDAGHVRVMLRGLAARRLDREESRPSTHLLAPVWRKRALPTPSEATPRVAREILFCGWNDDHAVTAAALIPDARCRTLPDDGDLAVLFGRAAEAIVEALCRLADAAASGATLLQVVVPDDRSMLDGLSGLVLTAGEELPAIDTQCMSLPADAGALELSVWLSEAAAAPSERLLRFDADGASTRSFAPLEPAPATTPVLPWRQRGVYWIVGGAGGLGMLLGQDIVEHVPDATVLLSGRRPEHDALSERLANLRASGARVEYHALDLADAAAVDAWVRTQVERFGRIDGIVHSAGELRDAYLVHKSADDLHAVLAAKVAGTLAIDTATRDLPLDFFALFASLAGVYGSAGQGDYAAGNAFLDAFAAERNRRVASGLRRGRTVSIDWPLWTDGGMRAGPAVERMMRERHGLEPLDTASGLAALHRALAESDADQVVVLHGHPQPQPVAPAAPLGTTGRLARTAAPEADTDDLRAQAEACLAALLAEALKMDAARVDPRAPLENYGIDSIKVMDLTFALEKHFGTLSKTLFFEYQSISELTDYFLRRHPERLAELLDMEGSSPDSTSPVPISSTVASSRAVPLRLAAKRAPGRGDAEAGAAAGAVEPIAIVGLSGRYPKAEDLEHFWENLRAGRDCVTEIPASRWEHARFFDDAAHPQGKTFCRSGGFLDGVAEFDPLFFKMTPLEATYVDPQERLFLQCAFSALEDAGYTRQALRAATGGRVGVYVGVMYEEYPMFGVEAQGRGKRVALTGSPSSIANRVSYFCNFSGPSMAVDSMCSSSLVTLHLACQSLRLRECEAAIAGGVNLSIHPNKYILLEQGHFASSNGRCESFGRGGDGYVPGEGVGAALLKPLVRAEADGDHIHGVILGSALNHGGKTNGYTVPNPNAQGAVIADALAAADVPPSRIGYVEAHGTGTALGDPIEITGLCQAYEREDLPRAACPIGSVKSNIGHCESAAGIAGLSKVLLQMRQGEIAPSLHSDVLNPTIDFAATPFFVPQTVQPWPRQRTDVEAGGRDLPRIAGISSFGAGGANAHVIVREYMPAPRAQAAAPEPQAFVVSARTRTALNARLRQLSRALEREGVDDRDLADLAATLQLGREPMAFRTGFVASSVADLRAQLREVIDLGHARIGEVRQTYTPGRADETMLGALRDAVAANDAAALVAAWIDGADVPWAELRGGRPFRRLPLPTYPFDRTTYWADFAHIPTLPGFAPAQGGSVAPPGSAEALVRVWRPAPLQATPPPARVGRLCLLATPALAPLGAAIAARLADWSVRTLRHGVDADFHSETRCEPLLAALDSDAEDPACLLDLTALDIRYERDPAPERGKWRLLQGFVERRARHGGILLQATCGLADDAAPTLQGARAIGLYRAIGAEYPRLHSLCVDLAPSDGDAAMRADPALVERLIAELLHAPTRADFADVRHRGGIREIATFERRALPSACPPHGADEVVLVTGGTGGLGAQVARHLVEAGVRRIAVLGREPLPSPETWPQALATDADPHRRARLARLQALVECGATVRYADLPLSDADALATELAQIETMLGPISTVYHCAGGSGATPAFVKKPIDEIAAVTAPKIDGLRALDAALPTARFVLFSSVSGAVPALGAGQTDYAMANAHLDCFAAWRRARGHTGDRAVQWPLWSEVGMAAAAVPSAAYLRTGLPRIAPSTGVTLLDGVLALDAAVALPLGHGAVEVDPDALLRAFAPPTTHAMPPADTAASPPAAAVPARRTAIAAWLREVIVTEFGLPASELSDDRPFADYGVDSIFIVQAVARMQRQSGRPVDPALLFEHDTLARLADHLDRDPAFDIAFLGDAAAPVRDAPAPTVPIAPPVRVAAESSAVPATAGDRLDIAVVGLACRLPGARDREAYWRLLEAGTSAIGPVPDGRWRVEDRTRYLGGWVDDIALFDPAYFGLTAEDARIMDPQARIVLEEAVAAFCDAGYRREELAGRRMGVYIGGRSHVRSEALDAVFTAPNPILGIGQNYLATNVSRIFDLTGPSLVVDTACSSGVTGIALAADALRRGHIDMALAGAVSLLRDPVAHELFAARNILSQDGRFRLFERHAGGEVLGEGAGLVVLKRLDDALRDGDRIQAVIRAIAVNNDGRTLGPGSPNLQAQRRVLQDALAMAGLSPGDVGYLEVNGGGSPVPDSIEIKALSEVYRLQDRSLGPCHVGSIKPNLGHLLLTSGVASFMRCVLSLGRGRIPPFLSAYEPFEFYDFADSRIVFDRAVTDWKTPADGRRIAAMSSFADGGTNCHVLIEEGPADVTPTREPLPLPPMQRQPVAPPETGSEASTVPPVAARRTRANAPRPRPEPETELEGAVENFWGHYVDKTV